MIAILNCWGTNPAGAASLHGKHKFFTLLALSLLVALPGLPLIVHAGEDVPSSSHTVPSLGKQTAFAGETQKAFETAKARYQAEPINLQAAWQFARACYDWADFATSNAQREQIADQGITAARMVIQRDPNSPNGHYYLALNLGQLARTRKLGALKLVGQMEMEFKTTLKLDPALDYAGADRGLGLLYLDAPGWPLSLGSKSKARLHLLKSVKLFPNFPENPLNLIEAYLKWGDRNSAVRELKVLDDIWPAARQELAGEKWAASWADWTARRDDLRKQAQLSSRTSPHD